MVTVRIKETGEELDLFSNVTYVKQVSDISDITSADSSYTWQLTFPKSPRNTKILKSLGVAGSNSLIPYRKIVCQILDNGISIEDNGNLIITETNDKGYIGYVKAGIVDFLQDISNDSINDIIDLSQLTHLNTPSAIINSFTAGLRYKYIVAYYNGQLLDDIGGVSNLNNFALVPSIDVEWLFIEIFAHYGWTFTGNFDFTDLWMTYPNAIGYTDIGALTVINNDYFSKTFYWNGSQNFIPVDMSGVFNPTFVTKINSFEFQVQESGNYQVKANAIGQAFSFIMLGYFEVDGFEWRIVISNQPAQPWNQNNTPIDIPFTLTAGTTLYLEIRSSGNFDYIEFQEAKLVLETRGIQEVDFGQALIKIKIKDFIKEMMIRNAMTPFVDVEKKHIDFKTFDERIDRTGNVVDWSNKYVGRTSEKYVYNSYAQDNLIKHKYNESNQDYADGILVVDNENLPSEKTLYQSFSYAPEEGLVQYRGLNEVYNVQNFRMFDVEVKEDENGDLIANYKNLRDRFYFIKSEDVTDTIYVSTDPATQFPIAGYSDVFSDVVSNSFSQINKVIDSAKIVEIDLILSKVDFAMVDLSKVYYFSQERAYFLLNRVIWKNEETSKGEFVKINY